MRPLFRIAGLQAWRSVKEQRVGRLLLMLAGGMIVGVMASSVFSILVFGMGGMTSEMTVVLFSTVYLGALLITFWLAMPQLFKRLFTAGDMHLLVALPIPTRYIYWLKFVQSFIGVPVFVWLFLVLPFFMLGIGHHVHALFYVVMPISSLAIVVTGMCVAYIANFLLVQVLPAHRANELMVIISGMSIIIIPIINIAARTGSWMDTLSPSWLMTTWAGQAIVQAANGQVMAIWYALLTVFVALVLAFSASLLVERGFRHGWIRLRGGFSKKRIQPNNPSDFSLRHPIVFIGLKEWYSLKRDPREWIMFVPILVMQLAALFYVILGPSQAQSLLADPMLSWVTIQAFILFFISLALGMFTAASIGREQKASWLLQVLPLTGMQIAKGKVGIHWLIPFVIVAVLQLIAGIWFDWTWYWIVGGIVTYGWLSIGVCSIGLWSGTIGAKYNPNKAYEHLETGTGFMLLFFLVVYLLLLLPAVVMVLVPVEHASIFRFVADYATFPFGFIASVLDAAMALKVANEVGAIVLGIVLLVAIVILVSWMMLVLSARRIERGVHIHIVEGKSAGRP